MYKHIILVYSLKRSLLYAKYSILKVLNDVPYWPFHCHLSTGKKQIFILHSNLSEKIPDSKTQIGPHTENSETLCIGNNIQFTVIEKYVQLKMRT